MNREEEIKTLKEEINKKLSELSNLRDKVKELEVGELVSFIKGKYLKFGTENVPMQLENTIIYIHENYPDPWVSKRPWKGALGETEYDLMFDCISLSGNVCEYADETYFTYDAYHQVSIFYRGKETVDEIINSAKEIDKEMFLKYFNEKMNEAYKDLFETLSEKDDNKN